MTDQTAESKVVNLGDLSNVPAPLLRKNIGKLKTWISNLSGVFEFTEPAHGWTDYDKALLVETRQDIAKYQAAVDLMSAELKRRGAK